MVRFVTNLGMDLDYTSGKHVRISMIKCVNKVIEDFPDKVATKSTTPAADHLFDILGYDPRKLLPEEQGQYFPHSVVQLLFLCMHARPDLRTVVSFLTTLCQGSRHQMSTVG